MGVRNITTRALCFDFDLDTMLLARLSERGGK
jgi:hypothetical protein